MKPNTLVSVAALAVMTACGSGDRSTAPDSSSAQVTMSTVTSSTAGWPELNASGGRALVLAWMNGTSVSAAEYDELFDSAFRGQVSAGDFETLRAQIAAQAPWVAGDILQDDEFSTAFRATSQIGGTLVVSIVIDPDSGSITGLLFGPDAEFDAPMSTDEAVERLQAFGSVRLLVADASDGSCAPIIDERPDEVMPLGSVFKLYVLGAIVAAVDDGMISWDTPVVIDDALDSLPSGDTQDLEPGTERTVHELAGVMISASDNTATDHLIDVVGRDTVEAALDLMGNDAVELNTPFLTTRELFVIKWGPDGLADRYRDADESGRRALLDGEVAAASLPAVEAVVPGVPVQVEEVEWFASPRALCRALVWLAADDTATEILARNPGIADETDRWSEILFKGGSEPGLLAVGWLTRAADGGVRVTSGSVVDPNGPVDEIQAAQLFAYLRDNAD